MKTDELVEYCLDLFGRELMEQLSQEWGFSALPAGEVRSLGYTTNLTRETVAAAVRQPVDLLLTHHTAWDFIYGLREFCVSELRRHGVGHFFVHAPLDGADFGTSASLAQALGLTIVEKSNPYANRLYAGRVGEYPEPIAFAALADKLMAIVGEPVRFWQNHDRPVRRVCVTTGGGFMTNEIKEAVDRGCDTYITGEKVLYSVQYARFAGINLLTGSHTFTEVPGVASLAQQIRIRYPEVEIVSLPEEHLE